jgi:hypothetical protein
MFFFAALVVNFFVEGFHVKMFQIRAVTVRRQSITKLKLSNCEVRKPKGGVLLLWRVSMRGTN